MRQDWNDDRLDAFRTETQRRFEDVDRRFDEVDKRFDRIETAIKDLGRDLHLWFDALQRTMLRFSGALVLALIGFMIAQVWFIVTQV